MFLTCFSDASFCPHTFACGWGGWAIRQDLGSGQFFGGPSKNGVRSPNEAEVSAIQELMLALYAVRMFDGVETIMLQSDSVNALASIKLRISTARWSFSNDDRDVKVATVRYSLTRPERRMTGQIAELIGDRQILLRHVKGHSVEVKGRSWVNTQCDAEAKRHMSARRREISGATRDYERKQMIKVRRFLDPKEAR